MDEKYECETEEKGQEKKRTNWTFLAGMVLGTALTLSCFLIWIGYLRWQMGRGADTQENDTPVVQQAEARQDGLDGEAVSKKVREIEDLIDRCYLEEADKEQMEEYMYIGLVQGLGDPYSSYFSAQELESLDESTKGVYTGIGAVMQQDMQTGGITVEQCYTGTPADEAGLLPGDVLVAVNEESIEGQELSEVVSKIKADEGETIVLSILRGGEEISVPVTRKKIEIPTVESRMLEDGIGYLRIVEFDDVTVEQTDSALRSLEEAGMEKLIVDLRGNPGGVLDVVCDVLDLFLPECRLVYTEDKYGNKNEFFADDEEKFEKPLAVLIDQESASAAEIFAGAIRDNGAGTLVGTTTFGKGIVQRVFNLSDGSGVKLTIAKYYTPSGQYIQDKGIEPDVVAELAEGQQAEQGSAPEDDSQLKEAVRVLQDADTAD